MSIATILITTLFLLGTQVRLGNGLAAEHNCEIACFEGVGKPSVKEWAEMYNVSCNCHKNPGQSSYTARFDVGCDLCHAGNDFCVHTFYEWTYMMYEREPAKQYLCFNYTKGYSNDMLCETIDFNTDNGTETKQSLMYNRKECTFIEEMGSGANYDCDGIPVNTNKDEFLAGDLYQEAYNMLRQDSQNPHFGGMDEEADENESDEEGIIQTEQAIVVGSCRGSSSQSFNGADIAERRCWRVCLEDERVQEWVDMFHVSCECIENSDKSFTASTKFDCDVCNFEGDVCLRYIEEFTYPSDGMKSSRIFGCLNYTKGHNGDSMCETNHYSAETEYQETFRREGFYNGIACEIVEELKEYTTLFNCSGVMIDTDFTNLRDGDPFNDAYDIIWNLFDLPGFMLDQGDVTELNQTQQVIPQSCQPLPGDTSTATRWTAICIIMGVLVGLFLEVTATAW